MGVLSIEGWAWCAYAANESEAPGMSDVEQEDATGHPVVCVYPRRDEPKRCSIRLQTRYPVSRKPASTVPSGIYTGCATPRS